MMALQGLLRRMWWVEKGCAGCRVFLVAGCD